MAAAGLGNIRALDLASQHIIYIVFVDHPRKLYSVDSFSATLRLSLGPTLRNIQRSA